MFDVCLFSSVAMSGEVFASSTTHSVIWGAGGESPMHRGLTATAKVPPLNNSTQPFSQAYTSDAPCCCNQLSRVMRYEGSQ